MVNSTGPVETNGSSFLLESLKLTDLKLENCNKITGDERSLLLIGTRHDEDMVHPYILDYFDIVSIALSL